MTRTTENRPLGKLDRVAENVAQSKSNPGNGILGRTSSLLVFRMPGDSEAWTFYGGVVTVTVGPSMFQFNEESAATTLNK